MRDAGLGRAAGGRIAVALAVAGALIAFAMLAPGTIGAQQATYTADLTGAFEVPAVTTTATGTFTATIDEMAQTITYTLSVPAIVSATAAHIHQGAAGTNGPVVLALYTSAGEDTVNVTQTLGAADLAGPLAGDWPGFLAGMLDGSLYVNVHTTANPGGEIRGQVAAPTVQAPTATATPAAPAATPAPSTPPAPAATGNAGLVTSAGGGAAALALAIAAFAAVAAGRALTGRDTRR